ncbi:hypothetical protein Rumeso_00866 [Rubellimicrobium mesophilum DSM 19309]|uniref:Uncharacterized protein n=1 Tax=Rubellimicrobium mesophilum DSM 19309 TaxID=442562 RepID=A0A017HTP2_9RHOB|nr:hypothetical protein Rumeso_00866 [Rubellimicrobium mesophilum DSM 19309]
MGHRLLDGRLGGQRTRPEGRDFGHGTRASCSLSVFLEPTRAASRAQTMNPGDGAVDKSEGSVDNRRHRARRLRSPSTDQSSRPILTAGPLGKPRGAESTGHPLA